MAWIEISALLEGVESAIADEEAAGDAAVGDDGIRRQDETGTVGDGAPEPDGMRRQDEIGTKGDGSEELQEEVEAARESVSALQSVVNEMEELLTGPVLKEIALFVGKNMAIGAILCGVSVLLKKMAEVEGNPNAQAQYQIVSALSGIVKDMSEKSSVLLKWLQSNQDTTVDVGDGITVPLPDIFYQFTEKMNDVSIKLDVNIHRPRRSRGNEKDKLRSGVKPRSNDQQTSTPDTEPRSPDKSLSPHSLLYEYIA